MNQERLALLALHLVPGVGSFTIRQLISYCGTPHRVFSTPKNKLIKIPGIGPALADAITNHSSMNKAGELLGNAEQKNVRLLFHTDDDYPDRLRHIPDSPSLLFYRGNADMNTSKVIAIVGTRKATSYGRGVTRELVEGMRSHQPLIISGLAYGIDAEAHRSAITNDLSTIGVMAGGIEYIYPASHRKLAADMQENGGLLTENGIDSVPDASRFPARNRIIAGLSDVVLVIEAAERGGALITASIANDYDREVMAVPGTVYNKYSAGCNNLIRRHRAHLLSKAEDVEYLMNWTKEPSQTIKKEHPPLDTEEQELVSILESNAGRMHLDRLSWASRKAVGKTASLLLQLEFKNVVVALPGKIFELRKQLFQEP